MAAREGVGQVEPEFRGVLARESDLDIPSDLKVVGQFEPKCVIGELELVPNGRLDLSRSGRVNPA